MCRFSEIFNTGKLVYFGQYFYLPGVVSESHSMAVMLETSLGEMVIDLFTEKCPIAAKNFLKLCKYVSLFP